MGDLVTGFLSDISGAKMIAWWHDNSHRTFRPFTFVGVEHQSRPPGHHLVEEDSTQGWHLGGEGQP